MKLAISNITLKKKVEQFYEKLNKYYPEHKIFALDSIDKTMREKLTMLYPAAGYNSEEEFLDAYGYQKISGEEVHRIRSSVIYKPGEEPDIVKDKVTGMLRRLEEYYPDHQISGSLQNSHKSLSQRVSGLYQWLGYSNAGEMLEAYGFHVQLNKAGRPPENDYSTLILILQEKYKDGQKAKSLGQLTEDNPEYAGQLKSLSNISKELFGMSLGKYLKQIGVIQAAEEGSVYRQSGIRKIYHYFWAEVDGQTTPVPCTTSSRAIHEGDYVEMSRNPEEKNMIGKVTETCYYGDTEALPCSEKEMWRYEKTLKKSELKGIEASKTKYILCSVKLNKNGSELYYLSPFGEIEIGDRVKVDHQQYGTTEGTVIEIKRVSEKNSPFPIKKTKSILEITKSIKEEQAEQEKKIYRLAEKYNTEEALHSPLNSEVQKKYQEATYFARAVFRGFESDIQSALRRIYPKEWDLSERMVELQDGIGQFSCESRFVPEIIRDYPNLKGICFAEYWKDGSVYLAYSQSGSSTVSDLRFVGNCDFYQRNRWTMVHDPTEECFDIEDGKYEFNEKSLWESIDFVLPDGKTRIISTDKIASRPYPKKKCTDVCEIVKIRD